MTERTASPTAPAGALARPAGKKARPYHHGALPEALLQAAETVLKRDGLRGLTLRAIAREADVSHTAPQHHFGDTAGVLSELAAIGHRRLADEMTGHARGTAPGKSRRKAMARGYIDFAVKCPDLFRLMSRNELLDPERASLVQARQISAHVLASVFDTATKAQQESEPLAGIGAAQAIAITAAWGYVHGLATLLIDHRLDGVARAAPDFADAHALVEAVIDGMQMVPRT